MTERWGDRIVGEETGLIAERLGEIRVAKALERLAPPRSVQSLVPPIDEGLEWSGPGDEEGRPDA